MKKQIEIFQMLPTRNCTSSEEKEEKKNCGMLENIRNILHSNPIHVIRLNHLPRNVYFYFLSAYEYQKAIYKLTKKNRNIGEANAFWRLVDSSASNKKKIENSKKIQKIIFHEISAQFRHFNQYHHFA